MTWACETTDHSVVITSNLLFGKTNTWYSGSRTFSLLLGLLPENAKALMFQLLAHEVITTISYGNWRVWLSWLLWTWWIRFAAWGILYHGIYNSLKICISIFSFRKWWRHTSVEIWTRTEVWSPLWLFHRQGKYCLWRTSHCHCTDVSNRCGQRWRDRVPCRWGKLTNTHKMVDT